jgi:hypothetical protein
MLIRPKSGALIILLHAQRLSEGCIHISRECGLLQQADVRHHCEIARERPSPSSCKNSTEVAKCTHGVIVTIHQTTQQKFLKSAPALHPQGKPLFWPSPPPPLISDQVKCQAHFFNNFTLIKRRRKKACVLKNKCSPLV